MLTNSLVLGAADMVDLTVAMLLFQLSYVYYFDGITEKICMGSINGNHETT